VLPPDVVHLVTGPMAAPLATALDFAQSVVSPPTEKTKPTLMAFRGWCDAHDAPILLAAHEIAAAYRI
jgi:hypothetical protein